MPEKNLFSAETIFTDLSRGITIEKEAVISYINKVPMIQAHSRSVPLSNKSFGIGRDRSNAVIVSDPKVSKFHATVTFKLGKAYLKDIGSKNGTYINKKKVNIDEMIELKNQDVIILGSTKITYKCKL